jgi:pimeloyl-ACP methyl ester carboxylesterase
MSRADSRPSLPAMQVPVMLLWGDADGIATRAHQDEMLAGLPNARLEIIAGGGHLATLEQPEAVNAALLNWLS